MTRARWKILLATIALLSVGAGIGYSAIPSGSGVISACRNANGGLRVIDREGGASCVQGEVLLEWSTSGGTGESTVRAIKASPPATFRPTSIVAMLMPCSPRIVPTFPMIPGRSS